jgi:hypothetical protein
MPMPAPTPVDALRHYSRAVVLTDRGGAVSPTLRQAIDASGVRCEILGHPLLALAELIHLERTPREGDAPRLTLVVADREIDDLAPLFAAVRANLPHLAVWVFEGDLAIEIQRGQAEIRAAQQEPRTAQQEPRPTSTPVLRIAPAPASEPAAAPPSTQTALRDASPEAGHEAGHEAVDEDPPGPSGNSVTPEELEMLLDLFDGNDAGDGRPHGGSHGGSHGGPTR